jgi:hypothetical protein
MAAIKEDKKPLAISRKHIPDCIPIFGNLDYRGAICLREDAEQKQFFATLRAIYPKTWGVIATHVPNEMGGDSVVRTIRAKAVGLTPGACDIIIPGNPTFCCEMKRRNSQKSHTNKSQIDYLVAAQAAGAFVCYALGSDAALEAFSVWREALNEGGSDGQDERDGADQA